VRRSDFSLETSTTLLSHCVPTLFFYLVPNHHQPTTLPTSSSLFVSLWLWFLPIYRPLSRLLLLSIEMTLFLLSRCLFHSLRKLVSAFWDISSRPIHHHWLRSATFFFKPGNSLLLSRLILSQVIVFCLLYLLMFWLLRS
jgi:hypothetical protein